MPVGNQTKETVTSAPDQKVTSTTSLPQKRRAIYIVLHVSTIKIGQLVGKASAPVKVHKYNPKPPHPSCLPPSNIVLENSRYQKLINLLVDS